MAKKSKDVAKFGGIEHLGATKYDAFDHSVDSVEAKSQTNLEMDKGEGDSVVLRFFKFKMNPQVFKEAPPTKQELFNAHYKGIEMALYRDGLKVVPEINPRLEVNEKKGQYVFSVGAKPRKGYLLQEKPQTLTEIARNWYHGWPTDRSRDTSELAWWMQRHLFEVHGSFLLPPTS